MTSYLIRFDDICPTMNWDAWAEIEALLHTYDIRPIVGIIPENKDPSLMIQEGRPDYLWEMARKWHEMNWTIAVHGLNHVFDSKSSGILGLNPYSEFAGHSYETQLERMTKAISIFNANGLMPTMWIFPAHSFDEVSLRALKEVGIVFLSDGFTFRPIIDTRGICHIPQQLWGVDSRFFGVWTFCYHPQLINKQELGLMSDFFRTKHKYFIKDISSLRAQAQKSNKIDTIFAETNRLHRKYIESPRQENFACHNIIGNNDAFVHKYSHYFTIFTPTYNRANILHRVYNSLCAQTLTDFEWLIIDDGSTDNTSDLISQWQVQSRFPIRYYFQENQGKHIAWNRAVDLARGEYFVCADSDDEFVPESLQLFQASLETIPTSDINNYFGVAALCQHCDGTTVGETFPSNISESNFVELFFRYNIKGEKWYCGKTQIHREIRFSEEFKGSYMPESTIWLEIGLYYKTILINKPLRIYFKESDSIMSNFCPSRNARGMRLASLRLLNNHHDKFSKHTLAIFLTAASSYLRGCFSLGMPLKNQLIDLKNFQSKVLWSLELPKVLLYIVFDKLRGF